MKAKMVMKKSMRSYRFDCKCKGCEEWQVKMTVQVKQVLRRKQDNKTLLINGVCVDRSMFTLPETKVKFVDNGKYKVASGMLRTHKGDGVYNSKRP